MSQFHGNGHEATKAPTLNTHAVLVDIGERLEETNTFHLVGHLDGAELTVGAAFKLEAAIVGTTIVDGEDHVALLGKEEEIEVGTTQPSVSNQLAVGAAVDVDEGGIFLTGLAVGRGNKTVVEIGDSVGSFDGAHLNLGHGIFGQGVVKLEEGGEGLAFLDIKNFGATRVLDTAVDIDEHGALGVDDHGVGALGRCEEGHQASGQIDTIGSKTNGTLLVGVDEDIFALFVKADDALHLVVAFGDLTQHLAVGVVEIEVLIAIAEAEPEKLVGVSGDEGHGVARLDVAGIGLDKEDGVELAITSIVAFKPHAVLLTIDFGDIDILLVGVPADVGEVVLTLGDGGLVTAGVEIEDGALGSVIDAHSHFMALHAGHGVFEGLLAGNTGCSVDEGIIGHHGLIHTVEGQKIAFGRPEGTLLDAELIAVHGLSENDVLIRRFDGEDLATIGNVEIVAMGVGGLVVGLFHVEIVCILCGVLSHDGEGLLVHVVEEHLTVCFETELLVIDDSARGEVAQRLLAGGHHCLIQHAEGKTGFGLAGIAHIEDGVLNVGYLVGIANKLESPHGGLGIEASCHQLLRAEHLVLSGHADGEHQCRS